ncbi:DUF2752 domain-containing protein [Streptomyces sp. NPDC046985]|uniref:DUF2752 domain-containing protein n=1 Tax=Streptomyces sp. NPDC046985 TaxID=3155377 RepID=UPI0033C59FD3
MRHVTADSRRAAPGRMPIPAPRAAYDAPAAPAMHPRAVLGRLAVPAGILAAVAGAAAYVGTVDPNQPGHYPACPLLRLTGLYCPGCGGLRSAHALVHGDLLTALHDNALAVVGAVVFAAVWTAWAAAAVRGRPLRLALGTAQTWCLVALVVVFTVVRNLPQGALLHP